MRAHTLHVFGFISSSHSHGYKASELLVRIVSHLSSGILVHLTELHCIPGLIFSRGWAASALVRTYVMQINL